VTLIVSPSFGSLTDPYWVTPGDTRAEEDSVNTAVQTLDDDITASPGTPTAFVQAWGGWKAEWDGFYKDQGGVVGWFGRFLTGSPYSKTLDYREQLKSWRAKFEALGGQASGPGLVDKPVSPPSDLANIIKWATIAAVVLGGFYVLHTTGVLGGVRGLFTPARANPRRRRNGRRLRSTVQGPAHRTHERRDHVFYTAKREGKWGIGEVKHGRGGNRYEAVWFDSEPEAKQHARGLVQLMGRHGSTVEFRRLADRNRRRSRR
jgi:hypothetical protein